jgi:TetR/AcrR family transcriptional regulator, acrAB operon repressor
MARKTREDSLKTRALLLDAAEQVFFESGYARTSLQDVARQASVTRGAIYWHFKNKVDLFAAMVDRIRLPIESLAEGAACDCANPLEQLREISVRLLRETATNARRRRVLTILFHRCELVGDADGIEMRQRLAFLECNRRIESALERAVKCGQLNRELNVKRATTALQGYVSGLINNWLFYPEAYDLASQAEQLVDAGISMIENGVGLTLAAVEMEKNVLSSIDPAGTIQ